MAKTDFDTYHKWLGIPPKHQPPNHYRLLGVELFEDDADVIDSAANQRMTHLHGFATGEHTDLAEEMLNEIAEARLCLLDQKKKTVYDSKLRKRQEAAKAKKSAPSPEGDLFTPPKTAIPEKSKRSSLIPVLVATLLLAAGGVVAFSVFRSSSAPDTDPVGEIAATKTVNDIEEDTPVEEQDATDTPAPDDPSEPPKTAARPSQPNDSNPKPTKQPEPKTSSTSRPDTPDAETIPEIQKTTQKLIKNSIGMTLAFIPIGEFFMGSPESDDESADDEKPQHKVKITKAFYMGIHEVTQSQYETVMDNQNPSTMRGPNLPVGSVSWDEANEFCRKLSLTEGTVYRLPTEAEWEYACRAERKGKWSFGDSDIDGIEYVWYSTNSGGKPHPVGKRKSNGFGLFDMHGNVNEWCLDWYGENYYSVSPSENPVGPNKPGGIADAKIVRGGSYFDAVASCRSAYRGANSSNTRSNRTGFRVVRMGAAGVQVVESSLPTPASETSPPSPYEDLWKKIEPLLAARRYPVAITSLVAASEDSTYADYKDTIESDKRDIQKVMSIFMAAERGVMQLKPGDKVRIKGIGGLRFVTYDPQEKVIVSSLGSKTKETPLIELNASEIEEFAKDGLKGDDGKFIVAVFHSIDQTGDHKKAIRLLEELVLAKQIEDRWADRLRKSSSKATPSLATAKTRRPSSSVSKTKQSLRKKFDFLDEKTIREYWDIGGIWQIQGTGIRLGKRGHLRTHNEFKYDADLQAEIRYSIRKPKYPSKGNNGFSVSLWGERFHSNAIGQQILRIRKNEDTITFLPSSGEPLSIRIKQEHANNSSSLNIEANIGFPNKYIEAFVQEVNISGKIDPESETKRLDLVAELKEDSTRTKTVVSRPKSSSRTYNLTKEDGIRNDWVVVGDYRIEGDGVRLYGKLGQAVSMTTRDSFDPNGDLQIDLTYTFPKPRWDTPRTGLMILLWGERYRSKMKGQTRIRIRKKGDTLTFVPSNGPPVVIKIKRANLDTSSPISIYAVSEFSNNTMELLVNAASARGIIMQ